MKAQELRIGNLYDHNGRVEKVTPNTILEVWESERKWCKPIDLTEEWLLNAGFEKSTIDRYTSIKLRVNSTEALLYHEGNVIYGILGPAQYVWSNIKIHYVHQLQNLYFVLTGEELEFN